MPNWKTHLEIGKKLNDYLKYDEVRLNLFLLGNILPDINNCYIVTNISQKISHDITHMRNLKTIPYMEFYNKYKEEIYIKNPIFVGYLTHLYTDYIWNKNFYEKVDGLKIKDKTHDELRIIKQNDFKIYNAKFIRNIINLENFETALNEIEKISEVSIKKEDIERIMEFLRNQELCEEKMKFYTEEELDNLIEETIENAKSLLK